MKIKSIFLLSLAFVLSSFSAAADPAPAADPMTPGYWEHWNPDVQARIDRDIEKNRKADAVIKLPAGIPADANIKIEQISHDFIFGAHIFNYNQLGTSERNRKYKELFGNLFNSATIAFYWKKFEMEPGKPRFKEEYRDTEEYWNKATENGDPKQEAHWRRPATDPVVEFCESKGIRMHGHTVAWGTPKWHYPEWIFSEFCPADEKEKIEKIGGMKALLKLTPAEIEKLVPAYVKAINRLQEKRLEELAEHYGSRVHSWDIANESGWDFAANNGNCLTGDAICKSVYKNLMPGDYVYKAFKVANRVFPKSVLLNINETTGNSNAKYVDHITSLQAKGAGRIDIAGVQYHLFEPQIDTQNPIPVDPKKPKRPVWPWPQPEWDRTDIVSKAGVPIHMSEITISAMGNNARGHAIQAVMARNLYRIWFSMKPIMGITWWNVVDDCGASGEPDTSGLFTRDMEAKPSFYALDRLINHEWKTKLMVKADKGGNIQFRGFKGKYRVTWINKSGKEQEAEFYLKQDGDGNLCLKN